MPDSPVKSRSQTLLTVLIVIAAIPFLLFLPLVLAGLEESLFGTHFVEDAARMTGTHQFLEWLYESVLF